MAIKDYSATPASNITISGINIAEGCPPSGINDAIRQAMADLKAADWGAGTPKTDAIAESTAAAGVTIDGLLIKDGGLPGLTLDKLKVSADDTTAGYLETKLTLISNSGLVLATTSPAGDERRTIGVGLDTSPGLDLGAGGLKVKPGIAEPVRRAFLPASAFTPTTTNGATKGSNEYATNDIMAEYLVFDGATEKFAGLNLVMPPEWNRSTIKFKFHWAPGDAACTAGDTVEWEVAGGSLSDGDTIDTALGTARVISDTVLAGKNAAIHISGATPAITLAGSPALGDFIPIKISRNVGGTDDMTEVAWLFGMVLEYSVSNAVTAW